MQDKLNVYEIDAVKEVLKNALQDEKQALMEDVEYLMSLLDEETDVQVCACNQVMCSWLCASAQVHASTLLQNRKSMQAHARPELISYDV